MPRPGEPNPIARFYARLSREQWLWVLGSGLLLLISLGVWDIWRDDWPPNDADLHVRFARVPDQANGMRIMEQILDTHPGLIPATGQITRAWQFSGDQLARPRDKDRLRGLLELGAPALAEFDTVLAAETFQSRPATFGSKKTSFREEPAYYFLVALEARARLALAENRPDDAWADFLRTLRLARRMREGHLRLSPYIVTMAINTRCFRHIRRNVRLLAPDGATALARTRQLERFRLTGEAYARMVKVMYREDVADIRHWADIVEREHGLLAPVCYKPNRTRADLARRYREVLGNIGKPAGEMAFPLFKSVPDRYRDDFLNYYGQIFERRTGGYPGTLRHMDTVNAQLAVTRVALALAGYANTYDGLLPATLEELAPHFIDAIPPDPCTGRALLYDPRARRVWSPGPDGIDHASSQLRTSTPDDIVGTIPP